MSILRNNYMIKKRDSMKNIVGVVKRFMGDKSKKAEGFGYFVNLMILIGAGIVFALIVMAFLTR